MPNIDLEEAVKLVVLVEQVAAQAALFAAKLRAQSGLSREDLAALVEKHNKEAHEAVDSL